MSKVVDKEPKQTITIIIKSNQSNSRETKEIIKLQDIIIKLQHEKISKARQVLDQGSNLPQAADLESGRRQ